MSEKLGLLSFEEQYFERIWGGQKLRTALGKQIPEERPIGEAWVISDHSSAVSVVDEGPHKGRTLHELLESDAAGLLGRQAEPTMHGRFPLLLKILDAKDVLSVQVHPDDAQAKAMGEPDVGKTEMWHVLSSEPGSVLYCGLDPSLTPEGMRAAIEQNDLEKHMVRFPVEAGDSVFVAAGTVHAIGGGNLLAEIQQNSDLTYRLYDWGRTDAEGNPRQLHIDKSLKATHFGSAHSGKASTLRVAESPDRHILAASRYFAAESVCLDGTYQRETRQDSFHILLSKSGVLEVQAGGESRPISPGRALLVAGDVPRFTVTGQGAFLEYYVPDLRKDVVEPLLAQGHAVSDIVALGGDPAHSDLAPLVSSM